MGVRQRLFGLAGTLFFERPAAKLTLDGLAARLGAGGEEVARRAAAAGDSPANRDRLAHIVGIERWGQRRLRTLLGEPLVQDEHDGYRPGADLAWDDLRAAFRRGARADPRARRRAGSGRGAAGAHRPAQRLRPAERRRLAAVPQRARDAGEYAPSLGGVGVVGSRVRTLAR